MKLTIIFKDEFEERMKKQFGSFTNPQVHDVKSVHIKNGRLRTETSGLAYWNMDYISTFYCEEG